MPYATTDDGVRLYFEETGTGHPVILVHEFAGDLRSYELNAPFRKALSHHCLQCARLPSVGRAGACLLLLAGSCR